MDEELLVAHAAEKPSFIPQFDENGCRLNILWEADEKTKSLALVGGKPPNSAATGSDKVSLCEVDCEAETLVCDVSRDIECNPVHGGSPEVEEATLVAAQREQVPGMNIDEALHNFFVKNFANSLPGDSELERDFESANNLRDSNDSTQDKLRADAHIAEEAKAYAAAETPIQDLPEIEELPLEKAFVERKSLAFATLDHNTSIEFKAPQAQSIELPDDDSEEEIHCNIQAELEADFSQNHLSTEPEIEEEKLTLCHVDRNKDFNNVIEELFQNHEIRTKPCSDNIDDSVQSTNGSTGVALKAKKPGQPPSCAVFSESKATSNLIQSKDKPKSKGIFSFFKRSPKSQNSQQNVDIKEKSKSLPRNLAVNPTTSKLEEKSSPQKSGFFKFGSRTRSKSEKITESDLIASNSLTCANNTPTSKASTPSKSNIRVFEIMAQNGTQQLVENPPIESSNKNETLRATTPTECVPIEHVTRDVNQEVDGRATAKDVADVSVSEPSKQRTSSSVREPPETTLETETAAGEASVIQRFQSGSADLSQFMVVIAIDFGTTFSGYAFSFVREPSSVHMMSRWEGGDPGVINQKTPTILLLSPNCEFHSFGFTARDHYHDLSPEDAASWLYFDKFKMALYRSTDCNRQTTITAANGKKFPALEAVRMTLKFFKDHAMQELSDHCGGTEIFNDEIRWVVTVPAIWTPPAIQFMRLAAYEAGLASVNNPDQLVFALEPEAASVHIRRLRMRELLPEKPINLPLSVKNVPTDPTTLETVSSQFKTVTRYMVVDCGGGTVDITVHDINALTGQLQEVYKASGGPYGSCGIDSDFETLLCAIFGEDFIRDFRKHRPSGWVGLMMAFESRKRAANPFKPKQPLNVALPFSFIDYYCKVKGQPVEKAISDFNEAEIRWSSQGMLRLTCQAMMILFQTTVDSIKESIANIYSKVKGIQHIFLVGGLSESPILQQAIREEFGLQARVIVPPDASLAVLKGAVCFGLDTGVMTGRRSKLTYGAAVLHRFLPGKHPESKRVRRDGVDWCKDVFDKFVVVNQIVRPGETVVRSYTPAAVTQKHITVEIYSSERSDVNFVTDVGVSKCAMVKLNLVRPWDVAETQRSSQSRRKITTYMTFADTEIKVLATDDVTGDQVDVSLDFLSL